MTTVHGVRPPDLTELALREAVAELVDPYRDTLSDGSLLLVPDAHYPCHPSTGLVTNPDVVRAVLDRLIDVAGRSSVRIGSPPTEHAESLAGRGSGTNRSRPKRGSTSNSRRPARRRCISRRRPRRSRFPNRS